MEKPGWQTSEFWMALGSSMLTTLVILGVVLTGDKSSIESALNGAIQSAFALVANAAVIWRYIKSRTEVKINKDKEESL